MVERTIIVAATFGALSSKTTILRGGALWRILCSALHIRLFAFPCVCFGNRALEAASVSFSLPAEAFMSEEEIEDKSEKNGGNERVRKDLWESNGNALRVLQRCSVTSTTI